MMFFTDICEGGAAAASRPVPALWAHRLQTMKSVHTHDEPCMQKKDSAYGTDL